MKQFSRVAFWAGCLALLSSGLRATPAETGQADLPMRGIAAVVLDIDGLEDGLEPYGLGRAGLLAAMEERLAQAGIEVIDADAMAKRPDAALLKLRFRLMRAPYYFYLYSVNLSLHGKVTLAQAPGAFTLVETWSDGNLGAVQPSDLAPLRVLSLQLVDSFIALHAQQNPG